MRHFFTLSIVFRNSSVARLSSRVRSQIIISLAFQSSMSFRSQSWISSTRRSILRRILPSLYFTNHLRSDAKNAGLFVYRRPVPRTPLGMPRGKEIQKWPSIAVPASPLWPYFTSLGTCHSHTAQPPPERTVQRNPHTARQPASFVLRHNQTQAAVYRGSRPSQRVIKYRGYVVQRAVRGGLPCGEPSLPEVRHRNHARSQHQRKKTPGTRPLRLFVSFSNPQSLMLGQDAILVRRIRSVQM